VFQEEIRPLRFSSLLHTKVDSADILCIVEGVVNEPNILFILTDDLGWRDLGCYGSTFYETPRLDRFAREGMRFTDAYAACPVCSPTRASLLTGKYPATLGLTDWIDWAGQWHPQRGRVIEAPYVKGLPESEVTVAGALREGGYRTWHVGKWHLGGPGHHPDDYGFDVNIGGCEWGMPVNGYFSPWGIPGLADAPEGTYLTDFLTDEAIRLIRTPDERPFFLHLSHYAVHTPIEAPAALVDKYTAKAKRLGLDRIDPLLEGEPFRTEAMRDARVKHRMLQSDPAYAAMVENLDTNIGRVLDALVETGQAENTLVVFTSDNGGLSTGGKWEIECAPTCNLPLQAGKGWMYDGGTREPFLAQWPGRIRPGSVCRQPITSPDLFPTLLEAAGLPPRPAQHTDGTSFLPALDGDPAFDRGPVFWHYPHYGNQGGSPASAVRHGRWKLIEFLEDAHLELYDLDTDIGETRNQTGSHPALVRDLHGKLTAWRESVGARLPQPNPDWKQEPD
jgi:arylsulfatase A-like enzyme